MHAVAVECEVTIRLSVATALAPMTAAPTIVGAEPSNGGDSKMSAPLGSNNDSEQTPPLQAITPGFCRPIRRD
jgi:hypothetical protein